ncbi:hypothetical protein HI914_06525 [Erysiphe necator]|uniref:Uncharacterized protein n=1 Tax=Uncinula necator TaxID=52586 RepID=A0A0B1P4E1_UNCNE|nr:hypothetical protein HI914_06525 [Erysiphe necator]KHJ31771.1 hypothetical protein EV44_g3082 [Erysiphe necator]
MAHLSPATIFSPSVAKKQIAEAKEWNIIDNWLLTKFNGKTPPDFERNSDTLKVLLALATFNENADEENCIINKIEINALEQLQSSTAKDPDIDLLTSLETKLTRDGKTCLEALSNLSVTLNRPFPKIDLLGQNLIDLQIKSDLLDQMSDRIGTLETNLNTELGYIDTLIGDLQSQVYQPSPGLAKQITQNQRKIKEISLKLPELRDRVASLSSASEGSTVTLQDVKLEEKSFNDLSKIVQELELEVKSYHGLPPDVRQARTELENLRAELYESISMRDRMFENLVESTNFTNKKT